MVLAVGGMMLWSLMPARQAGVVWFAVSLLAVLAAVIAAGVIAAIVVAVAANVVAVIKSEVPPSDDVQRERDTLRWRMRR